MGSRLKLCPDRGGREDVYAVEITVVTEGVALTVSIVAK
jgi:hypothetical protein